jgi:LPS-assembly protein
VTLLEPTGEVISADFVELTQKFDEAFAKDIRILMTDRSRLAGNTGRRTGGVRTELRRGVYSPCDLCRSDPTRPPVWQLRAGAIVHDEDAKTVEYRNAVMELYGVPIFYTPYLSHPDPTVKRQSGFLAPNFANSTDLGMHATIPYYWAIAPDRDLTFAPMFTSEGGNVLAGEYRQRFAAGELHLAGSLVPDSTILATDPAGNVFSRDAVRGHIFGEGRWSMNDVWRSGFDVRRSSDQTYLRRYRFGGYEPYLTSRAFLEGFESRSFAAVNAYAFQTLRAGTQDANQPVVLPELSYNWVGLPDGWGGRWSFDTDFLNLWRDVGTDTRRLVAGGGWQLPFKDGLGSLFTFSASLRGDGYYVTDFERLPSGPETQGFDGRVYPQVALEWRYPMVRRGEAWNQTIEPIAAVVAAPSGLNGGKIPNQDSSALDFDETMLFRPNRFPGYDLVDAGQRVDYGLRGSIVGDSGNSSSFIIGQSYRLQRDNNIPALSGIRDRLSDIVGRVTVSPGAGLDLIYRFRVAPDDFKINRQEASVGFGPASARFFVSYLDLQPPPDQVEQERRHQISAGATVALTRYWTLGLSTTQSLSGDFGSVSNGISAIYRDECLAFITALSQSGVQDRDFHPGTQVTVSLVFKNLGEVFAPVFHSD